MLCTLYNYVIFLILNTFQIIYKVHEQLQKWNERKEELHQINDTNQVSKNK
jgi:hypothetical protein